MKSKHLGWNDTKIEKLQAKATASAREVGDDSINASHTE